MGDSDMPVLDPNDLNSPEIAKLKGVEDEGYALNKNTLVTFGYNLTTAGTSPMVTSILAGIYRTEMQLRDKIAEVGGPLYPSEPTTYYRPVARGSMTDAWNAMEGKKVGGSGQQLEGGGVRGHGVPLGWGGRRGQAPTVRKEAAMAMPASTRTITMAHSGAFCVRMDQAAPSSSPPRAR